MSDHSLLQQFIQLSRTYAEATASQKSSPEREAWEESLRSIEEKMGPGVAAIPDPQGLQHDWQLTSRDIDQEVSSCSKCGLQRWDSFGVIFYRKVMSSGTSFDTPVELACTWRQK